MSLVSAADLRAAGLLASDAAVASVTERFGTPGSGDNARVLEAVVAGGLRFEVLADRGFDIGATEYGGMPVSWRSPVADARALSRPEGTAWLDRFTGGLLVTCGLMDLGTAGDGRPLHGDISHRPASSIRVVPGRGRAEVQLAADVDSESIFGPALRLEREISSELDEAGSAILRVRDHIVNTGVTPARVAMLYHLNLGAPLVVPGTRVEMETERSIARDAASARYDWSRLPEPCDELIDVVFAHDVPASPSGMSRVRVISPTGLEAVIEWSRDMLPHLHQWLLPTRRRWALGIEPSTVPLFAADEAAIPDAPVLQPGESRTHHLRFMIRASLARLS